ncbi:YgfZ/GcvT domain-containing protein [Paucibacter sp. Y2R2-4]|uniref:CAF17-like 4Fe-4S cluster assembly/insertion protein YgfZ n=1 Tax=Paucibacter sp. Y2R2-4 TaxID=2893553 RepID=UPI0021E3AF81|nr:folate-binding protein [Paucibacter sp. Y2R2-4]MCV2348270.1 folate-binding protein [Paucibacter sp. Y2R2-4]
MNSLNSLNTAPLSGAARLSDWGLIRAAGEDAAKFLHSQLTQDFALLGLNEARLAGFCSAKGRLLATMIGWKPSEHEVLLALPTELLPAILKRLSMFVLRAKCKLSDASAELQLWGLVGADAAQTLVEAVPNSPWTLSQKNGATVIALPEAAGQARFLLVQAQDAAAPALPVLAESDWQWLDLQSGLAWVRSATTEQFVPQMLNLELLGGVNFKKGCYPGQEVVARSQYRGTLKRRTFLFALQGQALPGQEIFHSEDPGQPAGLVANAASKDGRSLILAETKIAALDSGSLHLGSVDGPLLQPLPLPYALTEAQ